MRSLYLPFLFIAGILAAPAHAKNLTVFAAASTIQILDEIRDRWNPKNTTQLRVIYGSSGALARQIENGAPADVYLSAHGNWIDYLVRQKVARKETRKTIIRNRLVLVAPTFAQFSHPFNLKADIGFILGNNGRLSIGDPRHVPAGIYAREALTNVGLWPLLAQRTVRSSNVRLALALVQRGEVPLGIVYYTDAIQTRQVRVIAAIDGSLHAPIEYQAILTSSASQIAGKLLRHLTSASSQKVYRKFGFLPPSNHND